MQITNESMLRVVHFSYVTGALLIAGCTCLGAIVGFSGMDSRNIMLLWAFVATLITGTLVIVLGALLNNGHIWAFYGICALAFALGALACLLVMLSGRIRAALILFPIFALGATCLNAWPEARWLRRRHQAAPHAPPPPGALTMAPPPPTGGRSRRG